MLNKSGPKIDPYGISKRISSHELHTLFIFVLYFPAGIYRLKVNNRNIRTRYEICLKLIIKIPEGRHWRRSGIFIVNFEHISHLALVFLLLTLNM